MEFTATGVNTFQLPPQRFAGKNVTITYWQGPIVKPKDLPANVSVMATFRSEIHVRVLRSVLPDTTRHPHCVLPTHYQHPHFALHCSPRHQHPHSLCSALPMSTLLHLLTRV